MFIPRKLYQNLSELKIDEKNTPLLIQERLLNKRELAWKKNKISFLFVFLIILLVPWAFFLCKLYYHKKRKNIHTHTSLLV